jgi:hypothetical protein
MSFQKIKLLVFILWIPMSALAQYPILWKNGDLQFQWIERPLKTKETDKTLVIHTKYYEIQCEKLEKAHTVTEPNCEFVHEMEKLVTRSSSSKTACETLTYKNCTVVLLDLDDPESHTIIAMSSDPSDPKKHLIWHISTPHKDEPLRKVVDVLFQSLGK